MPNDKPIRIWSLVEQRGVEGNGSRAKRRFRNSHKPLILGDVCDRLKLKGVPNTCPTALHAGI